MLQYGQKSFLIVDDFTDSRTSTRSMLRELGVRDVDTADSGEQALRMCAQKRYDFILQDFHLGDGKKNGQQVLEDLIIDKHISHECVFIMVTAESSQAIVLSAIEHGVSFPVVIKPTDGGSALGLSTAHNAEELRTAMVDAFAYGQKLMVEQRIDGCDVAVSVVDLGDGPIALPPVEISTDGGRYDYDARYTTDETEYFVPARLESNALADLRAAAIEAHTALGLRHLSRIDFVIDEDGTCWFIDANVAPGMTDTSLLPQAAEAADDYSFAAFCKEVVDFVASTGGNSTSE